MARLRFNGLIAVVHLEAIGVVSERNAGVDEQGLKREITEGGELKRQAMPVLQETAKPAFGLSPVQFLRTNWLEEEMHLTFKDQPYLEVNPLVARRESVLMARPDQAFCHAIGGGC